MDAEKVPAIILHKRKAHKKKKRSRKRQCLAQQNTQEHESDIGIVDNVQETATFDSLTSTIQIIKSEQVPEVKEKREKSLFPVKELVECHQCKSLSCSGDCDITITNHTGLRCRKCFIKLCKDDQFSFNNEIIKIPKEMSKNFVILGDRVLCKNKHQLGYIRTTTMANKKENYFAVNPAKTTFRENFSQNTQKDSPVS